MDPLVRFERVTCRYGREPVLVNVDLEIGAGEFVGIVGPSGSGKTTVLRAIAGTVCAPLFGPHPTSLPKSTDDARASALVSTTWSSGLSSVLTVRRTSNPTRTSRVTTPRVAPSLSSPSRSSMSCGRIRLPLSRVTGPRKLMTKSLAGSS